MIDDVEGRDPRKRRNDKEATKMMSFELMKARMGSMDEKRALIIKSAAKFEEQANEAGFRYAPVCKLNEAILAIMPWTDVKLAKQTVANMAAKGIIEISKSGKGFRLCK